MANLTPDDLDGDSIFHVFGDDHRHIEKLFHPPANALAPLTGAELRDRQALWKSVDIPCLLRAFRALPESFGGQPFARIDFLVRVKRHRGTITKEVAGYVGDIGWKTKVSKDLATKYGAALDETERLCCRFEDALTGSNASYQRAYREKRTAAATKAKEDATAKEKELADRESNLQQREHAAAKRQRDAEAQEYELRLQRTRDDLAKAELRLQELKADIATKKEEERHERAERAEYERSVAVNQARNVRDMLDVLPNFCQPPAAFTPTPYVKTMVGAQMHAQTPYPSSKDPFSKK
jgi:hypothetical protein